MSLKDSLNRSFNLVASTVLSLGGLIYGIVAISPVENDWGDRLDDIGLLVIGLIGLTWYVLGSNRFARTLVPVVLAGLALVVQLLAIPLENDDPAAFGDNYQGLVLWSAFLIFVLVQYFRTGQLLRQAERVLPRQDQIEVGNTV